MYLSVPFFVAGFHFPGDKPKPVRGPGTTLSNRCDIDLPFAGWEAGYKVISVLRKARSGGIYERLVAFFGYENVC